MKVGVGLPSSMSGVDVATIGEWAVRAEAAGFHSLAVNDRLARDTLDPIVTLAVASALTKRIRLMTAALLAGARPGPVYLAKQLATLDRMSGGRLTVGVAVGNRPEEYEHAGLHFERRGRLLDACLDQLCEVWSGKVRGVGGAIGPAPVEAGGPELLIAGYAPVTFRRVARYGNGWMAATGSAEGFRFLAEQVDHAWDTAGRAGRPRMVAQIHVALGDDVSEPARQHLWDTYGYLGPEAVKGRLDGLVCDGADLRCHLDALATAGCDEVSFIPCVRDPLQVDRLAEAIDTKA